MPIALTLMYPNCAPRTRYQARKERAKARKAMNQAGWSKESTSYQLVDNCLKKLAYMKRGFNPRKEAGFWWTAMEWFDD